MLYRLSYASDIHPLRVPPRFGDVRADLAKCPKTDHFSTSNQLPALLDRLPARFGVSRPGWTAAR